MSVALVDHMSGRVGEDGVWSARGSRQVTSHPWRCQEAMGSWGENWLASASGTREPTLEARGGAEARPLCRVGRGDRQAGGGGDGAGGAGGEKRT